MRLSARVLKAGPSMPTYVPPSYTSSPIALPASSKTLRNAALNGSPKGTCATSPSPKNVSTRCLVRSISWSGTTRLRGGRCSTRLPTAPVANTLDTPSCFSACTLARHGISVGSSE